MSEDLLAQLMAIRDAPTQVMPETTARLASKTVARLEQGWKRWCQYFDFAVKEGSVDGIPGQPKVPEDILKVDAPCLDEGTASAFTSWWARNTKPLVFELPTATSAIRTWSSLCDYIATKREAPSKLVNTLLRKYVRSTLVKDGFVVNKSKTRYFTDNDALIIFTKSAFSPNFPAFSTRVRYQVLFINSLTFSLGLRMSSHFPATTDPIDTATLTYSCFIIIVSPPTAQEPDRNVLSLSYLPPHGKTESSTGGRHPVPAEAEPWRSAVFWLFVLATIDDVLPMPIPEMLDPQRFNGIRTELKFNDPKGTPICQPSIDSKEDRGTWTAAAPGKYLKELSRVAGFAASVTPHSLRRMVAIFMFVSGES